MGESKEKLAKTVEVLKDVAKENAALAKVLDEKDAAEWLGNFEKGVVFGSEVIMTQLWTAFGATDSVDSLDEATNKKMKKAAAKFLVSNWLMAKDKIEGDVVRMKNFFNSQTNPEGKTKADVLKEIYT